MRATISSDSARIAVGAFFLTGERGRRWSGRRDVAARELQPPGLVARLRRRGMEA
jgi:hypothetical protein